MLLTSANFVRYNHGLRRQIDVGGVLHSVFGR